MRLSVISRRIANYSQSQDFSNLWQMLSIRRGFELSRAVSIWNVFKPHVFKNWIDSKPWNNISPSSAWAILLHQILIDQTNFFTLPLWIRQASHPIRNLMCHQIKIKLWSPNDWQARQVFKNRKLFFMSNFTPHSINMWKCLF